MKNELLNVSGRRSAGSLLAGDSELTLIDRLLIEQSCLTAVGRFVQKHENHDLPAQARYYQDLIPLSKPGPGEQYAFSVDLDTCTGCKACVSACHSLNGLDDEETWRDVGWLHNPADEEPYQQTVTTACHHCADPACMNGCPVKAYDKDPETGIVRHLDDQCIGCQYCMLKCPYEVPKYSKKRGIVRKCDMCSSRLAVGEAPACVQACPNGAIKITKVVVKDVIAGAAAQGHLVPGAFDSTYTRPTTVYHSAKGIPAGAEAGNRRTLKLEHAHFPLVFMLLLTQAAAGLYLVCALLAVFDHGVFLKATGWISLAGWGLMQVGLGASIFHLGRPLGAWRAFLGWRTSWMSREILVFGVFAGVASMATLAANWPWIELLMSELGWTGKLHWPFLLAPGLMGMTAISGVLGVFCSAMIYIDTRRSFWKADLSFGKFYGNMLWLGASIGAALLAWLCLWDTTVNFSSVQKMAWMAAGIGVALLSWEGLIGFRAFHNKSHAIHESARLLVKKLRSFILIRVFCVLASAVLMLCGGFYGGWMAAFAITAALGFTGLAQVIERFFYFVAVKAPRMPGSML